MKVVKDGKLGKPEEWKKELECSKKDKLDTEGCDAVMEVTFEDLIVMYWEGTHTCHYYVAVRCPQCGKYNRASPVPQPVWEQLFTPENKKKAVFDGFSEAL